MEKFLYDASLEGNTTILLMLLQQDPLILDKATINCNDDTPLHVAAMLGHVDFVKEILTRKPHLSMECDSQKRLPIHLASANGHVEVVRELILANSEACSVPDRDGRNPIHLAAIKGRCEVMKELVKSQPHAARAMVQQETILHLCVKYNQLEALKLLLESMGDYEFVNTKDADGNTILHLAVADKQIETINFLLLDTKIEVNASNTNGETAINILAQGPRDVKDKQIMQSLIRVGGIDSKQESLFGQIPHESKSKMSLVNSIDYEKLNPKKVLKNRDYWLDKKQNTLMLVASLLATMAFQAGTNPPSGVWQEDSTATPPAYFAGYAVMAYKHRDLHNVFLVSNTVGFVATLSIILLLISGLPFLRHRFFLWILMVIMWIATTSMSITYLVSIIVLTPDHQSKTFNRVGAGIVLVWIALMTLLVAGHTIQLMVIFTKMLFSKMKAIVRSP